MLDDDGGGGGAGRRTTGDCDEGCVKDPDEGITGCVGVDEEGGGALIISKPRSVVGPAGASPSDSMGIENSGVAMTAE